MEEEVTKSQIHTEVNARETETCRWSSFRAGEKKKKEEEEEEKKKKTKKEEEEEEEKKKKKKTEEEEKEKKKRNKCRVSSDHSDEPTEH